MLEICGKRVEAGKALQCELGPEGYPMPVTLICGAKPGKTLVVTAQIHSGEYAGTPAVIRLAEETDPGCLSGNLILFHLVNVTGFYEGLNAYIPEDHGNLNGCYPGGEDSVSGRIAAFFVREVFPHADALLDLHGGGMNEKLAPCLFFPGVDEKVRAASLEIASYADIPDCIISRSVSGEVGYAGNVMGIPSLLLERGYGGLNRKEWSDAYYRDLCLILRGLGMTDGMPEPVCEKNVYDRAVYLSAGENGLWFPAVELGQRLKPGDLLGHTEDFWGRKLREYHAEAAGKVQYFRFAMNAVKGHNLVTYVLDAE